MGYIENYFYGLLLHIHFYITTVMGLVGFCILLSVKRLICIFYSFTQGNNAH